MFGLKIWCTTEENNSDVKYYDPLATMFLGSQINIIKDIFALKTEADITSMIIFLSTWCFLFGITYGTSVPSGVFLPGCIIGCTLGNVFAKSIKNLIGEEEYEQEYAAFILLGAVAVLAGYTRMTYSLAVIMMETSH